MLALLLAATFSASPNVVLISVDTLRADHLGFYGHTVPTSPNLDKLAAQSLVFDDMVCEVPLTAPSFCAMMTSRYPRATGVTRNGIHLADDIPTIAEIFSAAGYETMCVTSNWTLKARLLGLNRGFDKYDDDFHKKRWVVLKPERDGAEVTDLAIAQLAARDPARPFFAWFHYSDPHAPYRFREGHVVSSESDYKDDPGAKEKARYDSEIAYTDAQIARLLEKLPRENTIIAFIADHGESLREHGYLGHGRRLYQDNLRIPFFMSGPGIAPGRTPSPARGVDVGPTLLDVAGLDPAAGMQGLSLISKPPAADRVRVVEAYGGAVPHLPGAQKRMSRAGPDLQAAIIGTWKLIVKSDEQELYHVSEDSGETNDLAASSPARVAAFRAAIETWTKSVASGVSADSELSTEDVEALKSLGYVD